jgi:hypothetical protein
MIMLTNISSTEKLRIKFQVDLFVLAFIPLLR